jgi:hypothetical protein
MALPSCLPVSGGQSLWRRQARRNALVLAATSMRQFLVVIFTALMFACCGDCVQQATGVVLDRQTRKPVKNVSLGKYEKQDSALSYSKRIYTDDSGHFNYHSISGGFRHCPDLVLYFDKPGFKTTKITFESFTQNDTVYLDKVPFNRDSSIKITQADFDQQIDDCIALLQTKPLQDISAEQHIQIMMCLNTIFMRDFKGGHYNQLKLLGDETYVPGITKVYKEWIPNRGMGFYFPTLQMELYGTPMLYAIYEVTR